MTGTLSEVECASLPATLLRALAELRALADVLICVEAERVWLRWERGNERALRVVLPLPGAVLYARHDGHWRRAGARLPSFDVPEHAAYRPLHEVLFPAPMEALPAPSLDQPAWRPQQLRLAPAATPQATTALMVDVAALLGWLDRVPASRFSKLCAAICGRQVLVVGRRLPMTPDGVRFWGRRVLRPLGYRLEPDLPESAVCAALGLSQHELLLFHADGTAEVISGAVLHPLSRAGLRRAAEEVAR